MRTFLLTALIFSIFYTANSQVANNMTLLANWDSNTLPMAGSATFNECWGYVDCDGDEYAILGSAGFFHFFDLSDPTNPVEIAAISGGSTTVWRDMKTFSKTAYGVCDSCNEGMTIMDLSDVPTTVTFLTQTNAFFSRAHNIFIDEENARLYAVGTNTRSNGVIILDLSVDQKNPTLLASIPLPGGYIHDIFVKDNIAYASHGSNGLYVYDFTDPNSFVTLGSLTSYPQQGYNHASWLDPSGNNLVFADETHNRSLKITDVSNLSNITVTSLFRSALLGPSITNSIAHNPFIRDNYAIVSYYHDGLQIFDISNPSNVTQIAGYDTEPGNTNYNGFQGCWGAYPFLPSGIILASDFDHGLFILQPTNITFSSIPAPVAPTATVIPAGPLNFCIGDSVILNAPSGYDNYFWYHNGSKVGNTDSFTALVGGDYYVEVCDGPCSAISASVTVVVDVMPNVVLNVTNNQVICENEDLLISVPPTSGSYQWYLNGASIPGANSNSILATEQGDYYVTAFNGTCSISSSIVTLGVILLPSVDLNVSGTNQICDDQSFTITAPSGANSYEWYLDGNVLPWTTNEIIVNTAGDYYLIAANGNCPSTSEIVTLEVINYPDVTLNVSLNNQICEGENLLVSISAAAENYEWFQDGVSFSVGSPSIFVTETGNYHVVASNGNCESTSLTTFVEVLPNPDATLNVATFNELCEGDELLISVPSGALTYEWFYNGIVLPTVTGSTYFANQTGNYQVIISNGNCIAISEIVTLLVDNYPVVNLNVPTTNEICEGDILAMVIPFGAASYQWYFNNNIIPGATNNWFEANAAGNYYVEAANGNCSILSEAVDVSMMYYPDVALNVAIFNEICEGDNILLEIPGGASTYQWFYNDNPIGNNTNSLTASASGNYYVIASNGNCESTSEITELLVNIYPDVALNVPTQNEICEDENIVITVPIGANSYQWYLDGNPITNNTNSITANTAGSYYVEAANGDCSSISNTTELTVIAYPDVTLNVGNNVSLCEGEEVIISVPTGAQNYEWFLNGDIIANATNNEITASLEGNYMVVASNSICEISSESVTVETEVFPNVTLSTKGDAEICEGDNFTVSVPDGAQQYQWFFDTNPLGTNSNSITVNESGSYYVVATNGDCESTSETLNLAVIAVPDVSLSPATNSEICEGESVEISVPTGAENYSWTYNGDSFGTNSNSIIATASGDYAVTASNSNCQNESEISTVEVIQYPDATLNVDLQNEICEGEELSIEIPAGANSYSWFFNGDDLNNNSNSIIANESGDYFAIASNDQCSSTSETANLVVTAFPDVSLSTALENEICKGETFDIAVPDGAENYQWFINDMPIGDNGSNITVSESGSYSVIASNGDCSSTSEVVNLTVTEQPSVNLSVPSQNTICVGESLDVSIPAGADSYEWYYNSEVLAITENLINISEPGDYYVVATNGVCPSTSATFNLQTTAPPEVSLNVPSQNSICDGEEFLIEVPNGADSYEWYLNGILQNENSSSITALEQGDYYVIAGNGNCLETSETVNLTVIPIPDVTLNVANQNLICIDDNLEISVPEGAENYQWFFNGDLLAENSASIIAESEGTFYVIANNGNCEATSTTTSLIITDYPDVTLNVGSQNEICEGESLEIIAPIGAGSYDWYLNNELIATNTNFIQANQTGDYQLIASIGDCEATSAIVNLTILPIPDVELNVNTTELICEGEELLLEVPEGADSYLWFQDETPVGIGENNFLVTEEGEYYVTAILGNCPASSETVAVDVFGFDVEIMAEDSIICEDETTILIGPGGYDDYQWLLNGEVVGTQPIIEVGQGGFYSLWGSWLGCESVSEELEVTVVTVPIPEISFDGNLLTSTPANAYQWLLDGIVIQGATSQNHGPVQSGSYSVVAFGENDCFSFSEPIEVIIENTIESLGISYLNLFPNPVNDHLSLEINNVNGFSKYDISIHNVIGQKVYQSQIEFSGILIKTIEVKNLNPGLYLFEIKDQIGNTFVVKFVKD